MKINLKITIILTLSSLFIAMSCSDSKKDNATVSNRNTESNITSEEDDPTNTDSEEEEGNLSESESEAERMINAAEIEVRSLIMEQTSIDGVLSNAISYKIYGSAAYIKYEVCPLAEKNSCIESATSLKRFLLPKLFSGRFQVKAKGCIQPSQALVKGEVCGAWSNPPDTFNTGRVDTATKDLFIVKENLLKEIHAFEDEKRLVYKEFLSDAQVCIDRNAAVEKQLRSKMAFIEKFLAVPVNIIKESISIAIDTVLKSNYVGVGLQKGAGYTVQALNLGADKICEATKIDPFCDFVSTIAKGTLKQLSGMSPMHSIAEFSNNMHKISCPECDIAFKCSAETRMQKTLNSIQTNSEKKKEEYRQIIAKLKGLGEVE